MFKVFLIVASRPQFHSTLRSVVRADSRSCSAPVHFAVTKNNCAPGPSPGPVKCYTFDGTHISTTSSSFDGTFSVGTTNVYCVDSYLPESCAFNVTVLDPNLPVISS